MAIIKSTTSKGPQTKYRAFLAPTKSKTNKYQGCGAYDTELEAAQAHDAAYPEMFIDGYDPAKLNKNVFPEDFGNEAGEAINRRSKFNGVYYNSKTGGWVAMITKVASKKLAKCSAKKPGGQWSQEQRGDIGCTCPKIKGNLRTEEECISGTFVGHKIGEYATQEEAAKAYDTCEHLKDNWNKRNIDIQPGLYCDAI